jgi:hypothetical protein
MNDTNHNRRRFLQVGAMFAALPLFASSFKALAAEGKVEYVKESDPQATSLGYHADAKKVDVKKFPKRAGPAGAKQFCYNCQFYKPTGDAKTSKQGNCQILGNKMVPSHAWCNTWTQNPAVQG